MVILVVCAVCALAALTAAGLAARVAWANRPRPTRVYTPTRAQRRVAATRAHEEGTDPDATVVLPITWQ